MSREPKQVISLLLNFMKFGQIFDFNRILLTLVVTLEQRKFGGEPSMIKVLSRGAWDFAFRFGRR